VSAAGALALHALLLFATGPLQGGADLGPHLRLAQQLAEAPALRNVYAPAFHVAVAALAPWLGVGGAVKVFAWLSAAALLGGFRVFQRAAGLPEAAAAIFAWAPYAFALSWCLPKVEAAGYGIAFAGLGLLLWRRHVLLALALATAFLVHTAAALFLGLCGGVLALLERDRRALLALAVGTLLASPLLLAHLAAGCTLAQALLFNQGDYLRRATGWSSLSVWPRVVALVSPVALACALAGARELWQRYRTVSLLGLVVLALYTNELWLAPFGARTTLNLMRGLTILAFPVAAAAGVFAAAGSARRAAALTAACAVWALVATWTALPGSCHRVPVDLEAVSSLVVDRCTFHWAVRRAP
jgi:hypothetical protein